MSLTCLRYSEATAAQILREPGYNAAMQPCMALEQHLEQHAALVLPGKGAWVGLSWGRARSGSCPRQQQQPLEQVLASLLPAVHDGGPEDCIQKACGSLRNGCLDSFQNDGSRFKQSKLRTGTELFMEILQWPPYWKMQLSFQYFSPPPFFFLFISLLKHMISSFY